MGLCMTSAPSIGLGKMSIIALEIVTYFISFLNKRISNVLMSGAVSN